MKLSLPIKLRVSHKGLLIVGAALSLEMLLIGALTLCLLATDAEQQSEAIHRDKAMYTARLMFADIDAGVALLRAWRFHEMDALQDLSFALSEANRLTSKIREINAKCQPTWRASPRQNDALLYQYRTMALLSRIGDITSSGFSFSNLRAVWSIQQELNEVLLNTFSCLTSWYRDTAIIMHENGTRLNSLMWLHGGIIAGGIVIQIAAAFALGGYFSRNFNLAIESLRINVDRMMRGFPLTDPLPGNDELADLDQSFRKMFNELALASEREQALFDNASDVICILDENLEITRINSAAQRMWGYSAQWLSGASISKYVPESHWATIKTALEESRFNDPAVSFECDVKTRSGELMRCNWSTFWSAQNRLWFCVVHDVSEQHRLDELRESFLSMIAQDLQQPLHRIYSLFEKLASSGSFNESASAKISNSLSTLKRLTALVGELLDFERLQSPESRLELVQCNTLETLKAAARDIEWLASAKGVSIEIDCDASSEWLVDQSKIIRVVINLLSNAIKYSPENSSVILKAIDDNNKITVNVIDKGPGISAEASGSLFTAFQQVNSSDGKRGKGTGLGLAICKRLAELHHGNVGVDSTPGVGSTFWFTVPDANAMQSRRSALSSGLHHPVSASSKSNSYNNEATEEDEISVGESKLASSGFHNSRHTAGWLPKFDDLGLKRVRLLLIGLPLAFECLFVAGLAVLLIDGNAARAREIKERDLTMASINVCVGYCKAAIATSLQSVRQDPQLVIDAVNDLPKRVETLRALKDTDPVAAPEISAILKTSDRLAPYVQEVGYEFSRPEGVPDPLVAVGLHDRLLIACSKVKQPVLAFLDSCQPRQRLSPQKQRALRELQLISMAGGLLVNVLLAIGVATVFANSIARRLRIMAKNTVNLSHNEDLLPAVPGTDEISQLDQSFHTMAARLKEQRQKERGYLDNSRDVIGAFDLQNQITTVNRACRKLWRCSEDQLVATSVIQLIGKNERAEFEALLLQLREQSTDRIGEIETTMLHGIAMLWTVSWSSKEQCYFFVAHDITKRKELERLKKEFIAIVSHDLRSPLGTIYGTTELMLHGVFGEISESSRTLLNNVNSEVNQMLELINDLLDLEKLNAGQMKLELGESNTSSIVEKAMLLVDPILQDREQSLTPPADRIQLIADSDRLAQAIANLAVEISGMVPEGTELRIQTSESNQTDTVIQIQAMDTNVAPGLIQQTIQRMSNPQSESATGRSMSRLRLPLAKSIIESHGGALELGITRAGQPCFSITLPRSAEQLQPESNPTPLLTPSATLATLRPKQV